MYARSAGVVYVNMYASSVANLTLEGVSVELTQETAYPWDGHVRLLVKPAHEVSFGVNLRIPGWCAGAQVSINGSPESNVGLEGGYWRLKRIWRRGDVVTLVLPMPAMRMLANPAVAANRGRVALQRRPIVYCLEGTDNAGHVFNLSLPRESELEPYYSAELGGMVALKARGRARGVEPWTDLLYTAAQPSTETEIVAIPYGLWDNRQSGEMQVWIPEATSLAEPLSTDRRHDES